MVVASPLLTVLLLMLLIQQMPMPMPSVGPPMFGGYGFPGLPHPVPEPVDTVMSDEETIDHVDLVVDEEQVDVVKEDLTSQRKRPAEAADEQPAQRRRFVRRKKKNKKQINKVAKRRVANRKEAGKKEKQNATGARISNLNFTGSSFLRSDEEARRRPVRCFKM